MQSVNLAFVISQARAIRPKHPLVSAVRDAIEVGVVVPSILRTNLEAAGYTVVDDKAALKDYGFKSGTVLEKVLVTDEDGGIVAMGAAIDRDDALLHSMLGWFRENPTPGADVPEGLTTVSAPG